MSAKIRYSFLKILTGSDLSRRRIPFMMVQALEKGPVVWLTACGHGDEVGGIVIIQEVFKWIQKNGLIQGTLYAFPLMNPMGFETASRSIMLTKEDLNRSFPGNRNGSLAERIADKIFTSIIETEPSLVLDLHNDWIKSIPYALLDLDVEGIKKELARVIESHGKKSGLVLVRDTDIIKTSLSYSLIRQNIPSLTLELGESYIVNEINIQYGVRAVLNILLQMKMIAFAPEDGSYPVPDLYRGRLLNYTSLPLSSTSGIIRFLVKPGDLAVKNKPVARIYNAFGKHLETIQASGSGIVLGHSDSSVAFPGMPVVSFAVEQGTGEAS